MPAACPMRGPLVDPPGDRAFPHHALMCAYPVTFRGTAPAARQQSRPRGPWHVPGPQVRLRPLPRQQHRPGPGPLPSVRRARPIVVQSKQTQSLSAPLLPPFSPHPPGCCRENTKWPKPLRPPQPNWASPLTKPRGPRDGGHTIRRGGAQFLALAGIEVFKIQALARHSSTAIIGYFGDTLTAPNIQHTRPFRLPIQPSPPP